MPRTPKETFDLVQCLHLGLAESGRYYRVPFSERDKIIAQQTGLNRNYVSEARRAVAPFDKYKSEGEGYFMHKDNLLAGFMVQATQYFFARLRQERKYKNESPAVLDSLIGKWLGYSENQVRNARLGTGRFRKLRGCVDPDLREKDHDAEKTYKIILEAYERLIGDNARGHLQLTEIDRRVAELTGYSIKIAREVRLARGSYKKFGGINKVNRLRKRGPAPKLMLSQSASQQQ